MKLLGVPLLFLGIVCGFLVPLPGVVIDGLLVVNFLMALVLLITVLFIEDPLQLSSLPGMLLIATLFRLGLNVSTTRMILGAASARSEIVARAGEIAMQGNLLVGLVIFLIITLVQFVVISKGSERVAEVSARFMLDALPGRQMSIDADARAGAMTPDQAIEKRALLQTESRFYAALDGSMKFIRGDAIAGLGITALNLVGGFAVGVLVYQLGLSEAMARYSVLTVGDGLVSQVPALLNSLAAGMLITKVSHGGDSLASELMVQIGQMPQVQLVTGAVVALVGLLSSLPVLPLLVPGMLLILSGAHVWFGNERAGKASSTESTSTEAASKKGMSKGTPLLEVVLLSTPEGGKDIASATSSLQRDTNEVGWQFFQATGVLLHSLPIRFELQEALESERAAVEVKLQLRGGVVARYYFSSFPENGQTEKEEGRYKVWLSKALSEISEELISDEMTRRLLQYYGALGQLIPQEVIPGLLPVTRVTMVLRALVRSGVSIASFDVVVQSLAESAQQQLDDRSMVREARIALRRSIDANLPINVETSWYRLSAADEQHVYDVCTAGQPLSVDFTERVNQLPDDEQIVLLSGSGVRDLVEEFVRLRKPWTSCIAFEELVETAKWQRAQVL